VRGSENAVKIVTTETACAHYHIRLRSALIRLQSWT